LNEALLRAFVDFPGTQGPGRWRRQFADPVRVLTAWQIGEVENVLRQVQLHADAGRWCVGAVAYEAASAFDPALATHDRLPAWPLARFAVFEHALPWPETAQDDRDATCTPWRFSMQRQVYIDRVSRALAAMAAGECYQVNLTGSLEAEFSGEAGSWMTRLHAAQPQAYLLRCDWGDQQILSASPELFFDWRPGPMGRQLVCRPMKGTAPRHADAALDERSRQGLLDSDKERAENVMIVDLLRSDMGRIAEPGSVQVRELFALQALPTVWQMTSTITATTRPDIGLADIFRALFPCGSITGAPKPSAMRWIRELEDGPRGIYCGAAGLVGPGGDAAFNVPIRTVMLERSTRPSPSDWRARYGVGSGITASSNAQAEWEELGAKSRLVERSAQAFELLETLRLEDGRFWLVESHLARMALSAAYFGFAWRPAEIEKLLSSIACAHGAGLHRVRLTVNRLGPARAQTFALEPNPDHVRFALSDQPLDTHGRLSEFVLHKTTRRDHYDTRLQPRAGLFDVLLVNLRGELTEFTRGNLALQIGGTWLTPAAHCGLLPGTYRAELLAQGRIAEATLKPKDLQSAQGIAFFNSVRGWLRAELDSPEGEVDLIRRSAQTTAPTGPLPQSQAAPKPSQAAP
jgi:para-aminobenzoate synthetase/4-amino-4-deoxychorismate lyase